MYDIQHKPQRLLNMDENTSINKAVEQILESKPFIKDMFRIEVVNYSGLARYSPYPFNSKFPLEGLFELKGDANVVAAAFFSSSV